jgi:hypothetical protein
MFFKPLLFAIYFRESTNIYSYYAYLAYRKASWPLHAYKLEQNAIPIVMEDSSTMPLPSRQLKRNYGTYKHELKAIVKFATKYTHMPVQGSAVSTVWADRKPLAGFINSDTMKTYTFALWRSCTPDP